MAAPSFVDACTGKTDASGAWVFAAETVNSGEVVLVQILQDGATADVMGSPPAVGSDDPRILGPGGLRSLAGTGSHWTYIGTFAVDSAALQHLWIGRFVTSYPSGANIASGNNSTSEDLYFRAYRFTTVNTGTTLAEVIENVTAGATVNSTGTSNTAADASVETLGPDRLALNFVAVNDDNAISEFTGETGGDWTLAVAPYADSGGTDGAIALQQAAMASTGTIDGGSGSIVDSDAWGVIGFALIGTTPMPPTELHRNPAVTFYDPAVLMQPQRERIWLPRFRRPELWLPKRVGSPA